MSTKAKAKVPVTIKMPKALLKKWLAALRSGKLRQAFGTLRNPKTGGMCCLGVLEYCTTGSAKAIEKDSRDSGGDYFSMPSAKWLKEHGVVFKTCRAGRLCNSTDPLLPTLDMSASSANDARKIFMDGKHEFGFKQIADAIEACAVGV